MYDVATMEKRAPEGWFSQYDIEEFAPIVKNISVNGCYLEIGVHKGRSLWIAREVTHSSVDVYGIDLEDDPKIPDTVFIKGDSREVSWSRAIDVLFIDGNHDYDFVKADIEKYSPWIKSGGIILFHDCDETSPGVVQAVAEFAGRRMLKWEMLKRTDRNTSLARVFL